MLEPRESGIVDSCVSAMVEYVVLRLAQISGYRGPTPLSIFNDDVESNIEFQRSWNHEITG